MRARCWRIFLTVSKSWVVTIASWAASLDHTHCSAGLCVMRVRWPRVTSSTS